MHTFQDFVPETLIHEHDVLGTQVLSGLPSGYEGAVRVELEGAHARTTLCFPTVREAQAAAKFAISELGGYKRAMLRPAPAQWVTHRTWSDWAFDTQADPLH